MALISDFLIRHQPRLQDHGHWAAALHAVLVYHLPPPTLNWYQINMHCMAFVWSWIAWSHFNVDRLRIEMNPSSNRMANAITTVFITDIRYYRLQTHLKLFHAIKFLRVGGESGWSAERFVPQNAYSWIGEENGEKRKEEEGTWDARRNGGMEENEQGEGTGNKRGNN